MVLEKEVEVSLALVRQDWGAGTLPEGLRKPSDQRSHEFHSLKNVLVKKKVLVFTQCFFFFNQCLIFGKFPAL